MKQKAPKSITPGTIFSSVKNLGLNFSRKEETLITLI